VSFHLIGLELGSEEQLLERALAAVDELEPGETAFLPEALAWTFGGAARAFVELVGAAQRRGVNVVTSLNLPGELAPDLPGADPVERHHAIVVFTRHGVVHAPQAKLAPQSFESDARLEGLALAETPYDRWNLVTLDLDEQLVSARFLTCADLFVLSRFTPAEIACDLLVVLGNFPFGAERAARRMLGQALACGAARTALLVNGFHAPELGRSPLALRCEEVLDSTREEDTAEAAWSSPRALRSALWVYPDDLGTDYPALALAPSRRGRIPVPRSRYEAPVSLGSYPVTIVF
jgi:hypothetical protein